MQFLVALAALICATAALPVELRQAATEPCPEEYPQYQEAKRSQTNVFALQLLGSSTGNDEVHNTCKELQEGCYDKWAKQGLDLDAMQNMICNPQGPQTNATLALPKVAQSNSNVFSTQLLNAFDPSNTNTLSYLCDNLQYIQISGFLLNNNKIIQSTCKSSNTPIAPQPFTSNSRVNVSAVNQYRYAASKLYAYQYASAATTESQLQQYCAQAPTHHASWKDLQLQPEVVEKTLCSVKQTLSVDDAKTKTLEWTSNQFLAVVENISDTKGYKKWLCNNVNVAAMNNVGLDGGMIQNAICEHAGGRKVDGDD